MYPPTKDQADIGVENPTLDASDAHIHDIDETVNVDRARQEYKNDADINYMLSRLGVTQPRGAPVYGEWDDNIDLQMAIESVREAKTGFRSLPEELQKKFGTLEDFLTAVDNGSLVIKDKEPEPPPA